MKRARPEIEELLAELGRLPAPSEQDLRAMARTAASRSRPLPRPATSRGGLSTRGLGVVALGVAAAIGLGIGLGTLLAPSGTAANAAVGTGFLPQPGWTVLQSGADATAERQSLAVATNVRLHPEDDARGIRASSGLPYATLLQLPPQGVVIVVLVTVREPYAWMDEEFPERELPLRVRDSTRPILYAVPVRPDRPLGQYQLRARVNGHYVDVQFYFGTPRPSSALRAVAQRQLDGLVVDSVSKHPADVSPKAATVPSSSSKVIDRTLLCSTQRDKIEVWAHAGLRENRSGWNTLPLAGIVTPSLGGKTTVFDPSALVWITAARPSSSTTFGPSSDYSTTPVLPHGTLAVSQKLCQTVRAEVPLSFAGLHGGATTPLGEAIDCATSRRVLVRVRARFESSVRLHLRSGYARATTPIVEGAVVVRSESGRPLVYASVAATGKTRLFTARDCVPD